MLKHKTAIAACARWEEHDIIEWVEYHKAIGIEHVYIYSNDDDPSILRKLLFPYMCEGSRYVTFLHWPKAGQQLDIYCNFLLNFKDDVEWLCFLDIDEFIVLKKQRHINEFIDNFAGKFDCIYMNWLIYGNNGRVVRDNTLPILPYYTKRATSVNLHTKNFVRTSTIDAKLVKARFNSGAMGFWHFWDQYNFDMRICDVLGNPISGYTDDFPKKALQYVRQPGFSKQCLETAYVAHFQFKSEEDFIRRYRRGGFSNAEFWKQSFENGSYRKRLNDHDVVLDTTLAKFWHERLFETGLTTTFLPDGPKIERNIALFKPSRQSSVFVSPTPPPARAHLRDHANDGVRTGFYGIHTNHEASPWWEVDLLAIHDLSEIRIYNRADDIGCTKRIKGLIIEVSLNTQDWTQVSEIGESDYLGANGRARLPIQIALTNVLAQFVRLRLTSPGFLHVDEVEIYSRSSVPATAQAITQDASEGEQIPAPLCYLYNHGGLNNQRLALLGLFVAGYEKSMPIVLPDMVSIHHDDARPIENRIAIELIYDVSRLLRFAEEKNIRIIKVPPKGERGGWDYFSGGAVYTNRAGQTGKLDPDDFTCEFSRALVPWIRTSPLFTRLQKLIFDVNKIEVAVQLRIEKDWMRHAKQLHKRLGDREDYAPGFQDIIRKIVATFPEKKSGSIFVICDEEGLPTPKDDIRTIIKQQFNVNLFWKSDFLTAQEFNDLSNLERSLLDFELCACAPAFVGLTRSTFANMLCLEVFSRNRVPVRHHYIYNIPGDHLHVRTDNGTHSDPIAATKVV